MTRTNELADCITRTLDQYFRDLDGAKPSAIYDMVMGNAERAVLSYVLRRACGNQSLASDMLGINRNTLRRKLTEYKLQPSADCGNPSC